LKVANVKEQVWIALVRFDVVNHGRLRVAAATLQKALATLTGKAVAQQHMLTQHAPLLCLIQLAVLLGLWRAPLVH
jgi:hypothetical protein